MRLSVFNFCLVLRRFAAPLLVLAGAVAAVTAAPLNGPSRFVPERLEGQIFYVPVAQGQDQSVIHNAKAEGLAINSVFFDKYHAPLVSAVRSAAAHRTLSISDQVNLFGWLVIQTHRVNDIGYLWGGDLGDRPGEGTSGVGFDCSGFVWSVWDAIAPESCFANCGERLDSSSYRQCGRQVVAPMAANEDFLARLRRYGRAGDVIIMPGHICLYGYDPRSNTKAPIIMENGQFWNNPENWLVRFHGKSCEVRSCFSADGRLMVNTIRQGRALPPLGSKAPGKSLLIASAGDVLGSATEGKRATHSTVPEIDLARLAGGQPTGGLSSPAREAMDRTVRAAVEGEAPKPAAPEQNPAQEDQKIDRDIQQALSQVKAFDVASLPPPELHHNGPNHKPEITRVLTRGPELANNDLEFGVTTADPDYDDIAEYRVRIYGAKDWVVSDRPLFKTSLPNYKGEAILEFEVIDSRGAVSPPSYRKLIVDAPAS